MIVRPLTILYHKGKEFQWTEVTQEAFDTIKTLVASAPALRPIDYRSSKPVYLSVDSSYIGTGMVISQEDEQGRRHPARYGSIPMSERESRYSQPKLELFGLYRALRHWRLYLVGVNKLIVEVDAKYIRGMLNDPDLQPNASINRWIQGILLFDFELVHVPATKFKAPDALSRRPVAEGEVIKTDDDSWLDDIALLTFIPDGNFKEFDINQTASHPQKHTELPSYCGVNRIQQEKFLEDVEHFLRTLETPVFESIQKKRRFLRRALEFFVKDNQLYKRTKRFPVIVVKDPEKRLALLEQCHENLGHRGVQSVFETMRRRFYWPQLRPDIQHHVQSCHECQIRSLKRTEIPLTVSTPVRLFSKIYLDCMRMPHSNGYMHIVAARDDLSGTCEAIPIRHADSATLAQFLWDYIYCRYGAPSRVVTDNGPEFYKAFEILMRRMGIPLVRISAYNKHANGVVEQGHFRLRESIIKACKGDISQWPDLVAQAVFADRITVSRVTGFSPFQLLHATDPVLPLDLFEATFLVDGFHRKMSTSDLLALRIRQLGKYEGDLKRAAETLKKFRFRSKEQFERRFIKILQKNDYKEGTVVLVRNSAIEVTHGRKHKQRYLGPYLVIGRTQGGAYKLAEMDGTPKQEHCAAFRLLPYITRKHWFMTDNLNGAYDDNEDEEAEDTTETNSTINEEPFYSPYMSSDY